MSFFFFQAEDGIRDKLVTGVQTCALPILKGLIWTGSDDGLIHVTRDGGKKWTNVTPADVAPFTRISSIEASHFAPGTAYVTANRYQLEDRAPYKIGRASCRERV